MDNEPTQEVDEKAVDNLAENIYRGLELTVEDLQAKLPDQVDGMGANALRRVLKAVISYPEVDDKSVGSLTEREQKFMASMFALHQASVQLEIKAIGELQREYDLKQQKKGE